ncbi:MAG: hypothetical protein J0651_04065, partial [Actinobacteria bacterium]|nr:hypothetical protein [Actinomycetota bacterium]
MAAIATDAVQSVVVAYEQLAAGEAIPVTTEAAAKFAPAVLPVKSTLLTLTPINAFPRICTKASVDGADVSVMIAVSAVERLCGAIHEIFEYATVSSEVESVSVPKVTRTGETVPVIALPVVVAARPVPAALEGTTESRPKPKADTATSAMRLRSVFVDICFLSIS